jgi:AcrR family transcriptional regulator
MKTITKKKQALILTAKSLFAKKGFYGTPTAQIARDAGVSNGILFHYFPTKEELIKTLYIDIKDDIFKYTLSQVYRGATIKESLYTLWLATLEWYTENPEDFQFMLQFENSPYYSEEIERSHRYVQMAISIMEDGMNQGQLKALDPLFLVRLLSALVERSVFELNRNSTDSSNSTLQNQLFDVVWGALAK